MPEPLTHEIAETTREGLKDLILHGIKVIRDMMEDPDPTLRFRAAEPRSYSASKSRRPRNTAWANRTARQVSQRKEKPREPSRDKMTEGRWTATAR